MLHQGVRVGDMVGGNSNRGRERGRGGKGQGICFYFANHGNCHHGKACKWKHERGNGKGSVSNAYVVQSAIVMLRSKLQSHIDKR